jgi:competence protein ComEA
LRLAVSAFLFLVGSVFIGAGLFLFFQDKDAVVGQRQAGERGIVVDRAKEAGGEDRDSVISVDVAGAVNEPGVYSLPAGASVADALQIAGGFLDQTDKHWVARRLNMAEELVDRQKIYIPFLGEQMTSGSDSSLVRPSPANANKLIDLNLAGQSELESLPGIGGKRAEAIIKARPYRQTSDLLERGIVSERVYAAVKDLVTVGGG